MFSKTSRAARNGSKRYLVEGIATLGHRSQYGPIGQGGHRSNPRLRWVIWGALLLGVVAVLAPLGFNPFR